MILLAKALAVTVWLAIATTGTGEYRGSNATPDQESCQSAVDNARQYVKDSGDDLVISDCVKVEFTIGLPDAPAPK